ncbi:MAG: tail fiber domain-containing protein [bacterium]
MKVLRNIIVITLAVLFITPIFVQSALGGDSDDVPPWEYLYTLNAKDSAEDVVYVDENGNVGIGTTSPNYILRVNGSASKPSGGSWSDSSDERLQKNLQNLTGALDKLIQLQGITFKWINPEEHGDQTNIQAGLVAQEVEEVFPDWVSEVEPTGKDKELVEEGEKIKSLQFPHAFNAYLVEAIKELKAQNEELKRRIEALEGRKRKQRSHQ